TIADWTKMSILKIAAGSRRQFCGICLRQSVRGSRDEDTMTWRGRSGREERDETARSFFALGSGREWARGFDAIETIGGKRIGERAGDGRSSRGNYAKAAVCPD